MPCDRVSGVDPRVRRKQVEDALARLQQYLANGAVQVVVGQQGSVAFRGWTELDRNQITDLCAFRALRIIGSAPLRTALARAEALAGRKVDIAAIGRGVHSHDGGKTWSIH